MSPLTDDLVHFEFLSFFGKRGPKLDPVDTTLGPILQKKFFFPKDQPLGSKTTKFGEILIIFIANFFKFLITYEPGPAPIKSPTVGGVWQMITWGAGGGAKILETGIT